MDPYTTNRGVDPSLMNRIIWFTITKPEGKAK